MLGPRPPQSVARRREVAAMVVAHKQAAMIAPGHVFEGHAVEGLAAQAPAAQAPAEFPPGVAASPRRRSWPARLTLALMLPLAGPPVFLLKKRRMPVCRFTVDAQGIERRAGGGRLAVAWSDVRAVCHLLATRFGDDSVRDEATAHPAPRPPPHGGTGPS